MGGGREDAAGVGAGARLFGRLEIATSSKRKLLPLVLILGLVAPTLGAGQSSRAVELASRIDSRRPSEEAARELRSLLQGLDPIDAPQTSDDSIESALVVAYLRTRIAEIEVLELPALLPSSYLHVPDLRVLASKACGASEFEVAGALAELEALPAMLRTARVNLDRPARWWTEAGMAAAHELRLLLEGLSHACIDAPRRKAFDTGRRVALTAVGGYRAWLESDLLPVSDRQPSWSSELQEQLATVHEGLPSEAYSAAKALALAEREDARLGERLTQVTDLAPEEAFHALYSPDFGLEDVPNVVLAAERDLASWLGDGAPTRERVSAPWTEQRRLAPYYPILLEPVAESSYWILLPNRTWTALRAMGRYLDERFGQSSASVAPFQSFCLPEARRLYLDRWLEESGYFAQLPEERRRRIELGRILLRRLNAQRALLGIRLATGEISAEDAVASLRSTVGLSEELAWKEVRQSSMSPLPSGCGLVGEEMLLAWRQEFLAAGGSLDDFHVALFVHGDVPLPLLRSKLLSD